MSFGSIVRGLIKSNVEFVVVGGVAAAAHGSTIITNDLDVCYSPTDENVKRLAHQLSRWRPYPRGIEKGLPFIMDAKTFRITPILTLSTSQGPLDLLDRIEGVGDYAAVLKQSESVEAFDSHFRVLTLRALIAAKRAAGRPKDYAQLPELQALEALRGQKR